MPESEGVPGAGSLRIDRWLWHARFYRSRALATAAVEAGHVRVNGVRAKPSRAVRVGDQLAIARAGNTVEGRIVDLPRRRGPAAEARACFAETEESIARGVRHAQNQRLGAFAAPRPPGRPDKKARRELRALGRGQGEAPLPPDEPADDGWDYGREDRDPPEDERRGLRAGRDHVLDK